jgi:hypothetical protein
MVAGMIMEKSINHLEVWQKELYMWILAGYFGILNVKMSTTVTVVLCCLMRQLQIIVLGNFTFIKPIIPSGYLSCWTDCYS